MQRYCTDPRPPFDRQQPAPAELACSASRTLTASSGRVEMDTGAHNFDNLRSHLIQRPLHRRQDPHTAQSVRLLGDAGSVMVSPRRCPAGLLLPAGQPAAFARRVPKVDDSRLSNLYQRWHLAVTETT